MSAKTDRQKLIIFYALTMTLSTIFGLCYNIFDQLLWAACMACTPAIMFVITIALEAVIAGIVIFVWIRQRRTKAAKQAISS